MPSSHAISDRAEAIAFQEALVVIDVNGGLLHQLNAALIVSDFSHRPKGRTVDEGSFKNDLQFVYDLPTTCTGPRPCPEVAAPAVMRNGYTFPAIFQSATLEISPHEGESALRSGPFARKKTMTEILYKGLTKSI